MQTKDDAPGAGMGAPGPLAGTALLVTEGEDYARAWLQRLQAGTAQPDELAVILAFLGGEMLHGACRVIEKALGGLRHA